MLKLSEPRICSEEDKCTLRALYEVSFDDCPEVVDSFFENTFPEEIAIGIFEGKRAVSAMHLLKSDLVISDGEIKKVFYVYAVSTLSQYRSKGLMKKLLAFAAEIAGKEGAWGLFLVPAEESLFSLYEKCGYKKAFFYKEKTYSKADFQSNEAFVLKNKLTYEEYRSFVKSSNTVATLGEGAFKSFFGFKGEDTKLLFVENEGFLVYEKIAGVVTVNELWGNEKALLEGLFRKNDAEKIICRMPCDCGEGIPYGMLYELEKIRDADNMFFGTPYST